LHYGRDALVGIALFLTHLANSNKKCSVLRASYPDYFISKNKIELTPQINIDELLLSIKNKYKKQPHNTEDGLKIEFDTDWIHLRRSNTEPIIRIYAESGHESTAEKLAKNMIAEIGNLLKNHH
jgi:phosphomannomutase